MHVHNMLTRIGRLAHAYLRIPESKTLAQSFLELDLSELPSVEQTLFREIYALDCGDILYWWSADS